MSPVCGIFVSTLNCMVLCSFCTVCFSVTFPHVQSLCGSLHYLFSVLLCAVYCLCVAFCYLLFLLGSLHCFCFCMAFVHSICAPLLCVIFSAWLCSVYCFLCSSAHFAISFALCTLQSIFPTLHRFCLGCVIVCGECVMRLVNCLNSRVSY